VNILKRDDDALVGRNIDASDTSQDLFSIWRHTTRELSGGSLLPASGGGRPLRDARQKEVLGTNIPKPLRFRLKKESVSRSRVPRQLGHSRRWRLNFCFALHGDIWLGEHYIPSNRSFRGL